MFFTRIPCPSWTDHSEEYLNKSRKYFPLVGWIVGAIAASTLLGAVQIFSLPIAIILSIIASVWTTGAFHEDGFADVCDAFGGGWTKEQILNIMKDSRLGAYGTIGMFLILALKFACLQAIGEKSIFLLLFSLINAHASSRFVASTFIQTHDYVQDLDKSKSKPIASKKLSLSEMGFSLLVTLLPFLLFENVLFLLAFLFAYLPKIYLGYYFKKHIGGYTGDCLGATQQVSEIAFYLAMLLLTA